MSLCMHPHLWTWTPPRIAPLPTNGGKLDDWCKYWYFQNGTSPSCRSRDSWCRRFNVDDASLKSERFLNGPRFPDLLREMSILFVSKMFCLRHMEGEIFLGWTSLIRVSSPWCAYTCVNVWRSSWHILGPFWIQKKIILGFILGPFGIHLG